MVDKQYLLLVICLLLLPGVSAYSVEKISLEWQGHEVKTIAPDVPLNYARLVLRLSPDFKDCFGKYANKCYVVVDASSLSPDPAVRTNLARTTFRLQDCVNQSNSYICTSGSFQVRTSNASNPIKYYFQVDKPYPTQTIAIQLSLDTTIPKTSSIKTGFCDEETCYIASNAPSPFTVTFEDSQASFDYRLIFVDANPYNVVRVTSCSGKTCTGNITVPCSRDGQEGMLRITSMGGVTSREDAQNPVVPLTQKVICSTKAPQILDWKLTADGIGGQAVSGGSLTAVAKVKVSVGRASGVVDTTLINGVNKTAAVCNADNADPNIYTCTWQIRQLNPGKFDLSFKVADSIGNFYLAPDNKPVRVTVLNLTPNNKTTNFITLTKKEVIPERINRVALDLAAQNHLPFPAYVTYDVAVRGSAKILKQEVGSCVFKLPNETNYTSSYNLFSRDSAETRVLYPTRGAGENRLNVQIRANSDTLALSDQFDVKCEMKFVIIDGSTIYGAPEVENLTFSIGLRESPLGTPGDRFVEKIKETEDKLNGPDQKLLLNLRKIRATLDGACQIMDGINTITATGSGVQAIGAALTNTPFGAFGAIIENFGKTVFHTGNGITTKTYQDPITNKDGFIRKVCKQVNCRGIADAQGKSLGAWNSKSPDADTVADASFTQTTTSNINALGAKGGAGGKFTADEITKNLNVPDFRNSFIMSAMYGCVGGMVYNAGKWQDINCGYLQCLKEQSINGGSVAVCELGRSYKMCTQVVGEAFELPFARVVKNLASNMDGLIKDAPGFILKFMTNQQCMYYQTEAGKAACTPGDLKCAACHLSKAVTNIVDYKQQTTQVFAGQMTDDAICLQALCNPEEGKECERSYNKIEQYSQYTSYLQVNTWLNNMQKQGGSTQDQEAARQIGELTSGYAKQETPLTNEEWEVLTSKDDLVTSPAGKVVGNAATQQKPKSVAVYFSNKGNWRDSSGNLVRGYKMYVYRGDESKTLRSASDYKPVAVLPETQYQQMKRNDVWDAGYYTTASITTTPASYMQIGSYTVGPEYVAAAGVTTTELVPLDKQQISEADLTKYTPKVQPTPVTQGPTAATPAESVTPAGTSEPSAPKPIAMKREADGKTTITLDNSKTIVVDPASSHPTEQAAVVECDEIFDFLKQNGIPEDLLAKENYQVLRDALSDGIVVKNKQMLDEYARLEQSSGYAAMKANAALFSGDPKRANEISTLIVAYQKCADGKSCSAEQITALKKALSDKGVNIDSNGNFQVADNKAATITSDMVQCDANNVCSCATISCNSKTYQKKDGKYYELLTVDSSSAAIVSQIRKNENYYKTFDFLANIAVKYAYDKGYLNFLSTSFYGDWGRETSDLSTRYISPEGWKYNICNDMIYDIQDNDDGAIYEPSQNSFTRVAGTFAAEVQTLENESGTSYVYVYTIYITNPTRPAGPGTGNGDLYDFKVDAKFDSPDCTDCPNERDLINGTFSLDEGMNFAKGTGPRRGIVYSPVKYTRFCITFDKNFPESTYGKKAYCRTISENVFDTGSPVAGTATAPTTGSSSATGMEGEI